MHICIDISSAFDTISRYELLRELQSFLDDDEFRMCRILLSETKIVIKDEIDSNIGTFDSNIGSPQGDGISGTFFNIYLESELKKVRHFMNMNSINADHDYYKCSELPRELMYADDTDLITDKHN